jgi:hypothetical protein
MMKYLDFIEQAPLIRDIESTTTTGDLDYPGTALEISERGGNEIFHVVVDAYGEQQVLFLPSAEAFRIPLKLIEDIVSKAKEVVKSTDV